MQLPIYLLCTVDVVIPSLKNWRSRVRSETWCCVMLPKSYQTLTCECDTCNNFFFFYKDVTHTMWPHKTDNISAGDKARSIFLSPKAHQKHCTLSRFKRNVCDRKHISTAWLSLAECPEHHNHRDIILILHSYLITTNSLFILFHLQKSRKAKPWCFCWCLHFRTWYHPNIKAKYESNTYRIPCRWLRLEANQTAHQHGRNITDIWQHKTK